MKTKQLTILELLIIIKQAHTDDLDFCKKHEFRMQDGLCSLAHQKLSKEDAIRFKDYLRSNVKSGDVTRFVWERRIEDKSRLNWLNKHIELNK